MRERAWCLTARTITHIIQDVAIDGAAVKLHRERCGATRTQYATDLGISVQYLCDIEEGRRLLKRRPDLIKRMAERLNVPQYMIEQRRSA